jgi:acetolactate synthase-1/2/3 large subunit
MVLATARERFVRSSRIDRSRPAAADAAPCRAGGQVERAAAYLRRAQRPVLLIGSQAMLCACEMYDMAGAVKRLGVPVYLAGTARGLLGRDHPLQHFHRRREALREADLVILAGVPQDFRLDYGRQIGRKAAIVSVNLSAHDLRLNRRPTLGVLADPGVFLIELAQRVKTAADRYPEWNKRLRERDHEREMEICRHGRAATAFINPLAC